jgi:hypothetical protein
MRRLTALSLVLLSAALPASAWHDAGHMAIALIAYNDLGSGAKPVADLLRRHPDYAAWMAMKPARIDEDRWLFMRAAVWPDDIRSNNHPSHKYHQAAWHYAARFHMNPPSFAEPDKEPGDHIEDVVPKLTAVLKSGAADEEKARAVCWLFHLVGDIHNPLHAGSMVGEKWPTGDRGGNEFWIRTAGTAVRLHTFWDGLFNQETLLASSAGKRTTGPADVDFDKVSSLAQALAAQFERRALPELQVGEFGFWVQTSLRLAVKAAYLDYKLPGSPTQAQAEDAPADYAANCRKLAGQRAAVAGYRLADVMRAAGVVKAP